METHNISIQQAYVAMFIYLDKLYKMTNSQDLAGFLGGMSLLDDGMPVDQAVWSDWLESIEKACNDPNVNIKLNLSK